MPGPDPLAPPCPGGVAIGSLAQAQRRAGRYGAVLSIQDPQSNHRLRRQPSHAYDRLVIRFEDVDEDPGDVWTPSRGDAHAVVDFGRKHESAALLVHCFAGVARSTAAAYGILADRLGPGRESEALRQLLATRPSACPNLLLVGHLDDALCRRGALLATLIEHEEETGAIATLRQDRARHFARNRLAYAPPPLACHG